MWFGDGRYLLWSDIPNNRILKWEEETGAVSVYRRPSDFANGNTRDRQGRLVTCEHGGAAGHPHGVRRRRHGARGRGGGPAVQLPERRGGEVGTARSGSPIPPSASSGTTRDTGRSPSSPRRSTASTARAANSPVSRTTSGARTDSASPPTRGGSTWSSRGASRTRKILAYEVTEDGRAIANREVLIDAGAGGHPGRHALRRRTATSGAAGGWGARPSTG